MKIAKSFLVLILLTTASIAKAQQLKDCTLGIGGKDSATIIEIFQLNEEQQSKMEAWAAEFQTQNKLIEDQIQELFATHPQSTAEELNTLAEKYTSLQAKMVSISREYDKRLLALFNPRQYERYKALCKAAFREPLTIPEKLRDTVKPD